MAGPFSGVGAANVPAPPRHRGPGAAIRVPPLRQPVAAQKPHPSGVRDAKLGGVVARLLLESITPLGALVELGPRLPVQAGPGLVLATGVVVLVSGR